MLSGAEDHPRDNEHSGNSERVGQEGRNVSDSDPEVIECEISGERCERGGCCEDDSGQEGSDSGQSVLLVVLHGGFSFLWDTSSRGERMFVQGWCVCQSFLFDAWDIIFRAIMAMVIPIRGARNIERVKKKPAWKPPENVDDVR